MIDLGPHLLGRTLEHDPLSLDYLHPTKKITTRFNVIHTLLGGCLDQAKIGSCEGNTAVEFLNSTAAFGNRSAFNAFSGRAATALLDETDAVKLYSLGTTLDNDQIPGTYPPDDTGTSGVGIAKAMKKLAAIRRYNWTRTYEAFLATLQQRPVMLGTNWYQSMFSVDRAGCVVAPRPTDDPDGGHAFLAFARDWTNERTGCTNHWTGEWGVTIGKRPGCFWIHDSLLEQILIREQGDSLVPVLI